MNKNLYQLLDKEDPVEQLQRVGNGININDMGLKYGPGLIPKIPKGDFFKHSYTAVTKQHRYSYMPAHTHNFIEINYQFSGTSTQVINGNKVKLETGQLLFMDTDIIQKYGYTNRSDLLINVLIDPLKINSEILSCLQKSSILKRFLFNAQTENINHENYLIYDLNSHSQAKTIWEQLIMYGFTHQQPYETRGFLLIAALSCLPSPLLSKIKPINSSSKTMQEIITYIEDNYTHLSLDKISHQFGYNKNYLGNKIKKYTGRTFNDLLDAKKLILAESLLIDTNLPIVEIAQQLGYKNASSLYRLFEQQLGTTPANYRQANQHP